MRDVSVDEEVAGGGACDGVEGLSGITTSHEEEGRLLTFREAVECPRILPDPRFGPPPIRLQQTRHLFGPVATSDPTRGCFVFRRHHSISIPRGGLAAVNRM
jgi:hypothetical protein